MSEQVKILAAAAAKLGLDDQIELAELIMTGLPSDPDLETAWADEAVDRLAAYQRGEVAAEGSDVVLSRIRAKLAARRA
jgi:putative addiction module component (TIGR02574 family)